ncbi:hypothetical protein [Ruania zhangjianzhongii]|uniref:hypothetical protein n=1 Tax=Ruania zhangjianzhongii TaxID=2603206 RepID=UPI0011CBF75A|nr:hypothetical protein [Ruania zhangjianzhongii]
MVSGAVVAATDTSGSSSAGVSPAQVGDWLMQWLRSAEQDWHTRSDPDGLEQGWYGTGYTAWGMQTTLQYLAGAGAVAVHAPDEARRRWATRRALAALRFVVATHESGFAAAEDGRRWGRSWISVLGLERAGWVIDELGPQLEPQYRNGLAELLIDEADWQADHHERGGVTGIRGGRWEKDGLNRPESNLWCGAHLWRTAQRYPDHPRAPKWREVAVNFLINAVSVPSDADSTAVVDGVPVAAAHRGANFFESYALDHHGYLNVGYMVICASNAALALLDLRAQGHPIPEALLWHQRDLWQRIRPLIGPDGRLVRIGGDARVRYAYCQEYLLPALLLAEREFGDAGAAGLADRYLRMVGRERAETPDGLLYGRRLRALGSDQPYYRARLETDRACALGIWWHHSVLGSAAEHSNAAGRSNGAAVAESSETEAVQLRSAGGRPEEEPGAWSDAEHGFACLRGARRTASVSWRAASRTQALAFPTERPDMAEWALNLCPVLRFEGDGRAPSPTESPHAQRRVAGYTLEEFTGGFVSAARVEEGVSLAVAEGWRGTGPVADSWIVVAALPDDATVVGLHVSRARDLRPPLLSAHGLNLLIPNDVHNDHRRSIVPLAENALCVDDVLDVVADAPLGVTSHPVTDHSGLRSIAVEQISAGARRGRYWVGAGEPILTSAWVVRVRDAADPVPRLSAESSQSRYRVEVSTPAGRWRLQLDLDGADRSIWGDAVGEVTLSALSTTTEEKHR